MATVPNFLIICDKFVAVGVCTSESYACKYSMNFIYLFIVVASVTIRQNKSPNLLL